MTDRGIPTDIEPGKQLTSREKEALAKDNERISRQAQQEAAHSRANAGPEEHPLDKLAKGIKAKIDNGEIQER